VVDLLRPASEALISETIVKFTAHTPRCRPDRMPCNCGLTEAVTTILDELDRLRFVELASRRLLEATSPAECRELDAALRQAIGISDARAVAA